MDMFDEFYGGYPSRPRYYFPSPTAVKPVAVNRQSTPTQTHKVVSIPVQYVGSKRSLDRSDYATKIQKVLRGFLVRKSMKKIAAIKNEVDEIEKKILMKETVDLIRRDSKERLKINEMLMSLLFKLDSVPGVDPGVRDCRRTVIKKAIRLQEMVDAIVSEVDSAMAATTGAESVDKAAAEEIQDKLPEIDGTLQNSDSNSNSIENNVDENTELENNLELESVSNEVESENTPQISMPKEDELDNLSESQVDSSEDPQSLSEDDSEEENDSLRSHENWVEEDEKEKEDCNEVSKKNRELLEKMMEDNQKMMGLMKELFERNETQTRLLSSLSQRVEHLERALMCERLRKKKRNTYVLVDCLESTQDSKKSDKR